MSQKPQPPPNPGDLVRVRHGEWRVLGVTAHAGCAAVHLSGVGTTNIGRRQVVLHPFDRPAPLGRRGRLRTVTLRRWLDAVGLLEAGGLAHGTLRAAAAARIDLLPYQLEPALALERGESVRLLIADEVGLGKTIQAGLILAELCAREPAARTLVVTPAGLRDQWADELASRFSIAAVIVDAPSLGRAIASLPPDVNPWEAHPVVITSLDFIKQPEVSRALDRTVWDLLVVDEAHMAATARERRLAVDGLAARARRVVLLTATPHTGDHEAFATLCRIGQLEGDGPPLLFRRTSAAVGSGRDRRVRLLRIRLTPAESALHALLDRYSRRVWQEAAAERSSAARLAMIVLRKRALSSMAAVARSLQHRLEHLGTEDEPQGVQLSLPLLDEAAGESDEDDAVPGALLSGPGLADAAAERRWLAEILEAARAATVHDSKTAVLSRLLRRVGEPAMVFTEYRDTALALADALSVDRPTAVLHGGLDRPSRREVERRFLCGRARILVATDAAGQGLNFQTACRYVVNLELPWNPARLEQRIGRVDRIGQTRRVHAVNLVAAGTAEETILGRLVDRRARIRESIGDDNDPIGRAGRVAEAVILSDPSIPGSMGGRGPAPGPPAVSVPAPGVSVLPAGDLDVRAHDEAARLGRLRRLLHRQGGTSGDPMGRLGASLEAGRRWGALASGIGGLPPGMIALFRARLIDGRGRLLEEMLLPVHAILRLPYPPVLTIEGCPEPLARLAGALLPALGERARMAADARLTEIAPAVSQACRRARGREAAIARVAGRQFGADSTRLVQAGLFDQRGLRQAAARRLEWIRLSAELDERGSRQERAETLAVAGQPEPMLLLFVWPGS